MGQKRWDFGKAKKALRGEREGLSHGGSGFWVLRVRENEEMKLETLFLKISESGKRKERALNVNRIGCFLFFIFSIIFFLG